MKKILTFALALSVLLTCVGPFALPAVAQTAGPVVQYNFNETSGATVADMGTGGSTYNGTVSGGASFGAGYFHGGLAMNGNGQYVSLPAGVVSHMDSITVAAWVNMNSTDYWQRIFDFGTGTDKYFSFTPYANPGGTPRGLSLTIKNSGGAEQVLQAGVSAGNSIPTGQWTHVAFTLSGSTGTLYINGRQVAQKTDFTLKPSDLGSTANNYIGKSAFASDAYFNGSMDDFRIYNYALLPDDISALAAAKSEGPVIQYNFDETNGTAAANNGSAGSACGGTLSGATFAQGLLGNSLAMNGSGQYVTLPAGVVSGMDNITVAAWVRMDSPNYWQRVFDFGTGTDKYFSFTPYADPGGVPRGLSLTMKNSDGAEQVLQAGVDSGLLIPTGKWTHVALTLSGSTGTLYINGVQVAQKSNFTLKPSDLGNTANNYIGKSAFAADSYFNGRMDDFRIYDYALSADDMATLTADENRSLLQNDKESLTLGDLSSVTANLTLPSKAASGSNITWQSSDPAVIGNDGTVHFSGTAGQSTLTATLTRGTVSDTKTFTANVPALTDTLKTALDAKSLTLAAKVESDLTLPSSGPYGSAVTWASSDPAAVAGDGKVTRPEIGKGNQNVTLTATIKSGSSVVTREFPLLVMEKYAGYVFGYFTTDSETLHLSYSTDGLHWLALNGGQPVLTAQTGTRSIRDPYIYRKQDGKFIILATHGGGNSNIYAWDSDDLTSFQNERLLPVSNNPSAWAPECVYNPLTGNYRIVFAGNGGGNRISYNDTSDFKTVTAEKQLFNPGYTVIDPDIVENNGTFYLFYKDERGSNGADGNSYKAIKVAKSNTLEPGSFQVFTPDYITDHWVEGPECFRSNTENKWFLYVDYFMQQGKFGCETTADLNATSWAKLDDAQFKTPDGCRHGTIVSVTREELNKMLTKWGGVNILSLQAAVDTAQQKKQADYSSASWAVFQTAFDNAKAALADTTITQVQADDYTAALTAAINALGADTTALSAAVQAAALKNQADYSVASWASFQTAFDNAKAALDDASLTQTQADDYTAALTAAMDGLTVDKTDLGNAMEAARQKKQTDYTATSWAEFADSLKNADTVFASADSTQRQIDDTLQSLNAAMDALKPVDTSAPAGPSEPVSSFRPTTPSAPSETTSSAPCSAGQGSSGTVTASAVISTNPSTGGGHVGALLGVLAAAGASAGVFSKKRRKKA